MLTLSKSRFKIGLECVNKLYYTHLTKQYPSIKEEDTFLKSLAQGGFQVEELARMHFPDGHLVDTPHYDYAQAVLITSDLLKQDRVVIYEAAFLWEDLFIRADILVKEGNKIELIEVKAKLYDPSTNNLFVGVNGGLQSQWKAYLFDLAFQKYVVSKVLPDYRVAAFLMMADKSKRASVDGLNQMFRVPNVIEGDPRKGIIKKVEQLEETGTSILEKVNVNGLIDDIINDKFKVLEGFSFKSSIDFLLKTYQSGTYPGWPTQYSACKNCEFHASDLQLMEGKKSGFHECMKRQHQWADKEILEPNIFELWNFRGKIVEQLMGENRLLLNQLTGDDFKVESNPTEISSSERRWLQVSKAVNRDDSIFCLKDDLKDETSKWMYPLHFIDFETSAVALPFNKGRRPYEQVAFQFSHHKVDQNGSITHESEFISHRPGVFPNFDFARALMGALNNDKGTIFKFATHENTIINAIIEQLIESEEPDKKELIDFLMTISQSTADKVNCWMGERNMVDLRKVVLKYYYNPLTKGSNSIKYVLPAVLQSSEWLRNKYRKSLGEIGLSSRNFPTSHIWLKEEKGQVINPYKILPPLFMEWDVMEREELLSGIEDIADGGMALTAYAKLQYMDMGEKERTSLVRGLKKYCELDTLAMVMIYEHFCEIVSC